MEGNVGKSRVYNGSNGFMCGNIEASVLEPVVVGHSITLAITLLLPIGEIGGASFTIPTIPASHPSSHEPAPAVPPFIRYLPSLR